MPWRSASWAPRWALSWAWLAGRRRNGASPGDGEGHVAAQVVLHERERQVHTGGDAGGGPDVAVLHEDRVGVHPHGGVRLGEEVAPLPVGGGPPAVEQAHRGEQERAGAHGGDPAGLAGEPTDLGEQLPVAQRLAGAAAAGDDERVDRPGHVGQRPVGHHPEAAVGAQRPRPGGRHGGAVALGAQHVVGPGEHLEGPGQVQALQPGEGDEHDVGGHGASMRRPGPGSNDGSPTDPAIARVVASLRRRRGRDRGPRARGGAPRDRSAPGGRRGRPARRPRPGPGSPRGGCAPRRGCGRRRSAGPG